jgi:alpha-ketoglutarate-dependent taurine dioxygenase
MTLTIEPITPHLGARVLATPVEVLEEGAAQRLSAALGEHHVLIFPQIHMSDEDFLTLTASLGERHGTGATAENTAASQKGIFRVARDKDDPTQKEFIRGNDYWHMDGMNYEGPVKATLLKCENAPGEGGDTGFANLHAAYRALPEAEKARLAPLRVGHCMAAALERLYDAPTPGDYARWDAIFPRMERPLVWQQACGETSLLIGSTAWDIAGMSRAESAALLDELLDWCTQERFTLRHTWQAGDLVIFNNPALLHRSYPYPDSAGRVMHRTTLKGEEPFGLGDAPAGVELY